MNPDLWIPVDHLKIGNILLFSPPHFNPYVLYEGLILSIETDYKNAPEEEPLLKAPRIFEVEVSLEQREIFKVKQSQVVGLLDIRRVGAVIVPYKKG